jgi:RNA-directed DNA polymerase
MCAACDENARNEAMMLIEKILQRENMLEAHRRVAQNGGAPGVDGMTVEELWPYCQMHWLRIREEILSGRYKPQAVRKVEIPKPGGGGKRMLGIPSVLDRLIQQAICQVLTPIFDPAFSESSFGFRPGLSAHDAVLLARKYVADGYRWVVDLDLEKFFDRVNHDVLMARVARRVGDKRTLLLIRRFLQAGIMEGGVISARMEGTPQGGPLSPLLSNILLDDFDKELERRGHRFVRYADDSNTYVRSEEAGLRVMESLVRFLETKLRLKVNRSKSAVARPWKRKFLGYSVTSQRKPRLKIAPESVQRLKAKLRPIFRRARGAAINRSAKDLGPKLRGWINYYRLTQVTGPLEELDAWLRRKFRVAIWRHWKTPRTRFHKLVDRGVNRNKAARAAWGRDGPWGSAAGSAMNFAVPNSALQSIGLLSLVDLHRRLASSS